MNMSIVFFVILYLIANTTGLYFLKTSVTGVPLDSIVSYMKLLTNYKFIIGFLLYAMSFLVWIVLLSKKDLSYIFPIVIGLSYVCIIIMAILVLKEDFTLSKAVGATLIGLGIVTLFLQK